MTSLTLKDSAELIEISAIVASLIFVGMELRQSQEIAIASQYQTRVELNLGFFDNSDDNFLRVMGDIKKRQLANSELPADQQARFADLDSVQLGRSVSDISKILLIFDNSHFQYQAGFKDEESWQAIRRRTREVLRNSFRARFEVIEQSYQ